MKVCSVCQRCYADSVLSCSEAHPEPLIEGRAGNREIIANYRLDFLRESSPLGETYHASNTILNKPYLIKIIAPELFAGEQKSKESFLRETQSLSAIIHPNVARVYESGTLSDGSVYVVTEILTAQTLRDCLINVGSPSEVTALTITRQVAEGLEAIHAVGVLHRNISPENIILTSDAENRFLVKIQNVDFGGIRQKIVNSCGELNLNTLRYFSPEQCAGRAVAAQTDVYSLGVVLYEALAGQPPFDAPDADVLINKQINEPPPRVSIHNFDIRMLLTHTLTDALQKTTRLRLKTANAFARRIRHIEQLATHSPTPPPAMSYPATMDKAAIVFSPAPKIEIPLPVEKQIVVEEIIPVENQTVFENSAPVEKIPIVENLAPFETQTIIENSALMEELPVYENPLINETQPVVEKTLAFENPTFIEDSLPVEIQTAAAEVPVKAFGDYTTTKLPPIETLIGNSLTENAPDDKPQQMSDETAENSDIHVTNEAVLIDWEQPDDIPLLPKTLKTEKPKTVEEEFALETFFITDDEDSILDAGDVDAPLNSVDEVAEVRRHYRAERPVFSYDDSGTSWNLPEWNLPAKRKVLMGAGLVALLVLVVGGTLLSRQFQLALDTGQTTAQSAPNSKSAPKSTEPDKVSENDKSLIAKPETVTVSNPAPDADNADVPQLPDYQPRPIDEKPVVQPAQIRSKKRVVRETSESREQIVQTKNVSNEIFDKKGEVRSPTDKRTAVKSQPVTKTEVFTRPRIVKNPKF